VVGSDLAAVEDVAKGIKFPLEEAVLTLPHDAEFRIRRPQDGFVIIDRVEVILGPGSSALRPVIKIVLNSSTPSFVIDFFGPQRAVGLECGFLSEAGTEIKSKDVKLTTWNVTGDVIRETDGGPLSGQSWSANTVYNRIGSRDKAGGIRSVELRFELDDGAPSVTPIIYRIWHEPFPQAAVLQDTAAVEFDPLPGGTLRVPYDGPIGPVTVKLPFLCDRAVVLLRGFKMLFLDQQPHEIEAIEAGIGSAFTGDPRSNGIFSTEPGGLITVVPSGSLVSKEREGYRVLIYYLVLAWSSADVEVMGFGCRMGDRFVDEPDGGRQIVVQDPSPWKRFGVTTPVSPNLQGFGFVFNRAEEVELLGLQAGVANTSATCRPYRSRYLSDRPPFRNRDGQFTWDICTHLYGVDSSYRSAQGLLVVGPGVRSESQNPGGLDNIDDLEAVGRRDPLQPFFPFPAKNLSDFVSADMAFLSLGQFLFEPKGKLQELEVEVRGRTHDGNVLTWDVGFGISVSPPIRGGGPVSSGHRVAVGWPTFGGVRRRPIFPFTRAETQDVKFTAGIAGGLLLEPQQYGAVHNVGNLPIVLTEAIKFGAQEDEFSFTIEHKGEVFAEYELAGRAPLVLYPGQSMVIGGRFFPQQGAPAGTTPRQVALSFRGPESTVTILALGWTVPEEPHAEVLPATLNFGQLSIDPGNRPYGSSARNVLVVSDGATPLRIHSISLENRTIGFSFGIRDEPGLPDVVVPGDPYQIEPGASLTIEVRFDPPIPGEAQTSLHLETNAGPFDVRLLGAGLLS
jgi:hypothetical protein